MSRLSTRGRKAAEKRQEIRRLGPIPAVAGSLALALCLAPMLAVPFSTKAVAQSRSGIFINNDVLNNLGAGPEAAPLAPLAPAAPPTPLSPRNPPGYQAPAPAYQAQPLVPPSGGGNGGLTFQPYGSGNFVVTRPGTLLFPPLHDPKSTLAPGFAGKVDNDAARARALVNAFAQGAEPSSQLLIPLDNSESDGSVTVFMDALPPADPDADHASAPVLVLQAPPQPAPPKPAVPAAVLAEMQAPAALAPEFQAPEPQTPAPPAMAPAMAKVPGGTPVEQTPLAAAEPAEKELAAVDETPAPSPAGKASVSSAEVPAPVAKPAANAAMPVPATQTAAVPSSADSAPSSAASVPSSAASGDAPVSLLPAAPGAETPASPAGLQTASLTVGGDIEDMTFLFEVDSAELSTETQTDLRALAEAMRNSAEGNIQVLGFASGEDGSGDQARKLALSRALKVRSFLIDAGIPSARIRVRSLGDHAEGGPANRVDIKPIGS